MKYLATIPLIFTLSLIISLSSTPFAQEEAPKSPQLEVKTETSPKTSTTEISKTEAIPQESQKNKATNTQLKSQDFRLGRASEDSRSQVPDAASGLAKACASLAVILAVIMGIYYALRKFSKQIGIQSKDNPIRVHSKQMLDSKTSLYLIRVYEDEFLISVGPNGSSNIARYALIGEDGKQEQTPNTPEFREFLGETIGEDIKPAGVNDNV